MIGTCFINLPTVDEIYAVDKKEIYVNFMTMNS